MGCLLAYLAATSVGVYALGRILWAFRGEVSLARAYETGSEG